ncbi:MAG: chloramphenicol phosphotransferase CPT family protein [Oscillospiraceae bacterium]|nr:chloramphenicol phosphotransferase CPT family protein [Oscillospiraceae bacterium]
MSKGKIIILNGVSSAGKTSLSKTLQEKLNKPYYWFSEDIFREMTPAKYMFDEDEYEWAWIDSIYAMYHSAIMYSNLGMGVIIDTVMDDDIWLDKMIALFHDAPALFVHVTCPSEELARREKERGDRELGLAISQLSELHPLCNTYDIKVDTHASTTDECADKIIALLGSSDNFQAFKTLWVKRTK